MAETDTKERKNPEDPKETMDAKETKEATGAKTAGEAKPAKTEANGIRPADSMDNGRPPDDYSKISAGPIAGSTKIEGLRLDFNFGARIQVPEGKWRVRLIDLRSAQIVHDQEHSSEVIWSDVRYYVPWRIEVWQEGKPVFGYEMNLKGQRVFVKFCSGALGDSIAWLPYVEEFRKRHDCKICVSMSPAVAELFRDLYPEIKFVGPAECPGPFYASYYMGCFFPPEERTFQPSSWKIAGLQGAAAHILDLPEEAIRPNLRIDCPRVIKEPYVCIAAQASGQAKYWNNSEGWMKTVAWLKEQGYRVLCIDRDAIYGKGWRLNYIPYGAEDFTGEKPLRERLELLVHADFFIGLASGLSWLAWAAGIPVVLISGFSLPRTEFPTPYRVINYNVCTGCWEDDRYTFDHADFHWCPRHAGDEERQFECTRMINHAHVTNVCRRLMADHHLSPGGKGKE